MNEDLNDITNDNEENEPIEVHGHSEYKPVDNS